MPSCPFISNLSYHGISISIVGSRNATSNEPSSFVKEVTVGDNGELIIGLEDIISGKVILSVPKTRKDDVLEKMFPPDSIVPHQHEEDTTNEVSPSDSLKRGRDELETETSLVEVSPTMTDEDSNEREKNSEEEEDVENDDEGEETCSTQSPKKSKGARQSVKKKISLSSESSVRRNSEETLSLLSPSSSFSSNDGCIPEARWGHTMTKVTEGRFVIYGGQSEEDDHGDEKTFGNLFVYHPESKKWQEPENCSSVSRVWHTSSFVHELNAIVTFGGEREINGSLECLDDIMVLDTGLMLWYPPTVTGNSPTPRAGHSAAVLKKDHKSSPELVVFGGTNGRKWESSLHILDCNRWAWSRPKVSGGKPPAARSYHSATSIKGGKAMVIFGGNDGDNCFNDIVVLTSTSPTSEGTWSWTRPLIMGAVPRARTGHGACLMEDGKSLLIHGGWDPSDEIVYFNDTFMLDTETWEWTEVSSDLFHLQNSECSGITGHTIECVSPSNTPQAEGTRRVVLFGGQCSNGARVNDLKEGLV